MTETSNEILYCIGCGAKIQSENPNELGYTPESAVKKGLETEELYCQRCFRLRHYNEIADVSLTDDDFLKDSKLELYNEVIESLQEQEETTDVLDYEFDLEEE